MEVIINSEGSSINCENWILEIFAIIVIIGASLSEPHINGTAVRKIYAHAVWLYGHKLKIFYCAFSFLGHKSQLSKMQIYTRALIVYRGLGIFEPSKPEKIKAAKEDRAHHQSQSVQPRCMRLHV